MNTTTVVNKIVSIAHLRVHGSSDPVTVLSTDLVHNTID